MNRESPEFNQLSETEIRQAEAAREFNLYLESRKSRPVGTSGYYARNEKERREKYGIPSPDTLRGFEIIQGRVYPAVAHAVRQLNKQGIITRQQLAEADLEKIKHITGIGLTTYNIAVLLQNICQSQI